MTNNETVQYVYNPQEAAGIFLKSIDPSYNNPQTRISNPLWKSRDLASIVWSNMQDSQDRVKFLSEQPVTFTALVISRIETGLNANEERFSLYASAASIKTMLENEVMSYQVLGKFIYGNIDYFRQVNSRTPTTDEDYLREQQDGIQKIQKLQENLTAKLNNKPTPER